MTAALKTGKFRLKKGDTVMVISGKDKGKKGKVLQVVASDGKLVVEKINLIKKHMRPSRTAKGGIVEKEKALPVSKVMVICPQCGKPARTGLRLLDENKKMRFCKKCGEIIDKG